MAKLSLFVSATIVGIFVQSTSFASPVKEFNSAPARAEPDSGQGLDDNMAVTPAQPLPKPNRPASARYYPYRQALTVRSGYESGLSPVEAENWVLGFQYLFPKFLSPKLEAGADLIDNGTGHLHAGLRWFHNERSYFRPSLKLALDHLAEPENGIATLTKFENYYLRAAATLEYVVWNPLSARLELEVLTSIEDQRAFLVLGVSRGW